MFFINSILMYTYIGLLGLPISFCLHNNKKQSNKCQNEKPFYQTIWTITLVVFIHAVLHNIFNNYIICNAPWQAFPPFYCGFYLCSMYIILLKYVVNNFCWFAKCICIDTLLIHVYLKLADFFLFSWVIIYDSSYGF